jgi:hypothetical protein
MGLGLSDNIIKVKEDNYSIINENTDIWDGELPFKPGDKFPTDDISNRADISKTNRLIYNNNVDDIYTNIISVFPEIDPNYGWQIREIITSLPYFKNSTNAWVGLIAGDVPLIDVDNELDVKVSELIEASNFAETMQNEVRSRFMDIISAYRVDVDITGKPIIIPIDSKNLVCFVNKDKPSSIEVNVVFSIYKDNNGIDYVDFVEYHYNGFIRKHTMYYSEGTIGNYVKEPEESVAFGGKYKVSPIVVFKHNTVNNEIYGTDQYRYWSASMLAGMRELQNILRLGERTREMIRKVPNSAIRKNPADGSSTFYNKGTIGYDNNTDGESPDIEYIVPEIRMDEAVKALEQAIKQIGMDTQLGVAFYSLDSLGSRLSAESIRAAMFPARLEAKRMVTEMKPAVRELVTKLGYIVDIDISGAKMSIEFYDGFPKDELNDIQAIQSRLESITPSITLEDAIMKLDRVPLRVAREKANEIRSEAYKYNKDTDINNSNIQDDIKVSTDEDDLELSKLDTNYNKNNLLTHDLEPTAGKSKLSTNNRYVDDTVWDNQMIPKPRDIPQGISKNKNKRGEVIKSWTLSRLSRSH